MLWTKLFTKHENYFEVISVSEADTDTGDIIKNHQATCKNKMDQNSEHEACNENLEMLIVPT